MDVLNGKLSFCLYIIFLNWKWFVLAVKLLFLIIVFLIYIFLEFIFNFFMKNFTNFYCICWLIYIYYVKTIHFLFFLYYNVFIFPCKLRYCFKIIFKFCKYYLYELVIYFRKNVNRCIFLDNFKFYYFHWCFVIFVFYKNSTGLHGCYL